MARLRSRLRVATSSALRNAPRGAETDADRELAKHVAIERPPLVVSVVGPSGAGKSAAIRRALAKSERRVVWLDNAIVPSPSSLRGALAFALGLAPRSRADAIRRHLEGAPHALVIDGVHGPMGSLESAVAEFVGGPTVVILSGRDPRTRLLPVATVGMGGRAPRRLGGRLDDRTQRVWLEALALLGGGLTVDEACDVGRRVGIIDVMPTLALHLREGEVLTVDPHDPRKVRVPGVLRRGLVAAAEPTAARAAVAFTTARAQPEHNNDRFDFADASRRLALLTLADAADSRVLADALVRWSLRWGMEGAGVLGPLVPSVPLPSVHEATSVSSLLAAAEAAFAGERWSDAARAFERVTSDACNASQLAGYIWSLIELGRHDEAARHLAVVESLGAGEASLPMRAEAGAARALRYLDAGLLDDAESRLSHVVMSTSLKGRRRAASQARFWLLCVSALRAGASRRAGAYTPGVIEPFYAIAVAAELQQEGELELAEFARGLAGRMTGQMMPTLLDAASRPSTCAALGVLRGVRVTDDGDEPEGLLVRIARLIAVR